MRPLPALILALLALGAAPAHAAPPARPRPVLPEPRLVQITLDETVTLERLLREGLDIVDVRGHDAATVLVWPQDDARIAAYGLRVEVLDEHPATTAASVAREELQALGHWRLGTGTESTRRDPGEQGYGTGIAAAPPLGSGSMGGHWTLAEIKQRLDELVDGDTHDVVADQLDTLGLSRQGRPVWGLELGKRVIGPDTRARVFLNSLTHSREPLSMEALLYFADQLLSGYGVDPFSTYLLDQRRITLVPVVNPDGYAVNEATYFGSGGTTFGMWRKNTRDNDGNGTFDADSDGVDINRNFGAFWGLNDIGSSPDVTTEIYRGPSPFSEAETQIQRDAVIARQPSTGLSTHTYADLLLNPWSHTTTPTPHWDAFQEWNDLMTAGNAYQTGPPPRILYEVNGDFNDWAYGDTTSKPRAFTWTPEIGYSVSGSAVEGFWPPPSRILPLAQETMRTCLVTTAIAGPYLQEDGFSVLEGALNASYGAHLTVRARNVGLRSTGSGLTGTLTPLAPGIRMLVSTVSYPSLASRTSANPLASFELVVNDTITPGRLMRFQIDFQDADGLFSRDTIALPLGTGTTVAFDEASSGLGKWSPGIWGIIANDAAHPSRYFADSPAGNYPSGTNNIMLFAAPLDLSHGVHAYAMYESRWEFETDYDDCQGEAALTSAGTYVRLTGLSTTPGSGLDAISQPSGVPLFAGTRWKWRSDWLDLSPFAGPAGNAVRFRWRTRSDIGGQFDGFSFDSLRFVIYDPAQQPTLVAVGDRAPAAELALDAPSPNPARSIARTGFALPTAADVRLEVLDVQGRVIRTLASGHVDAGRWVRGWDLTDAEGHPARAGMYFLRLTTPARTLAKRLVVVR